MAEEGDQLSRLTERIRRFSDERSWGQFHNPKNLVLALAGEVGELAAEFQWLTTEEAAAISEDPERWPAVESEIADVFIYLLRLADVCDCDLVSAAEAKMAENAARFPIS